MTQRMCQHLAQSWAPSIQPVIQQSFVDCFPCARPWARCWGPSVWQTGRHYSVLPASPGALCPQEMPANAKSYLRPFLPKPRICQVRNPRPGLPDGAKGSGYPMFIPGISYAIIVCYKIFHLSSIHPSVHPSIIHPSISPSSINLSIYSSIHPSPTQPASQFVA